jgi:SAM-dependent methyltransferase
MYDDIYSKTLGHFGTKPVRVLRDFVDHLDPALPVLDVGAGQGRNTIPLLERGFTVVALDPSSVGLKQLQEQAANIGTGRLVVEQNVINNHKAEPETYGTILLFGLFQMLTPAEVNEMVQLCKRWLHPGGHLLIVAWTTDDPRFSDPPEDWSREERNSFRTANNVVHSFLEPNELRSKFDGYEAVHYEEKMGAWHRHGDGTPERHAHVEAVFCKPA